MTGTGIKQTSYHLLPRVPIIKDLFTLTGHLIENGTFANFTPTWKEPRSYTKEIGTLDNPDGITQSHTTGMMTTEEMVPGIEATILAANGNYKADLNVIMSHGFVTDVISCLLDYLHIPTHAAYIVKETMMKNAEKVGPNGISYNSAHSRGNILVRNASEQIQKENPALLKRIDYLGLAPPVPIRKGTFKKQSQIVSSRDGVCLLMGYKRWCPPEHVEIVPSNKFPLTDHDFTNTIYSKKFKRFNDKIQEHRITNCQK